MSRYIDADALIDKVDKYIYRITRASKLKVGESAIIADIKAHIELSPTIDAEPHWIPCSERMPNDDKDYLVTDGESMAVGYYRTDAKAWDNVNFGWIENREYTCGLKTVIAWMPLPKPYEGDKE